MAACLSRRRRFLFRRSRKVVEAKPATSCELKVQVKRLWPEFTDDIKLLPLSFPGNFQMAGGNVPAGATEATVTHYCPKRHTAGDFTIALLTQAQVAFNKDPKASDKPQTLVSLPSRPVTVA